MVKRSEICAAALRWRDTPFMSQRAVRGVGCDCLGLIRGIAHDLRLDIGREAEIKPLLAYGDNPDGQLLTQLLSKYLSPIDKGGAKPGDVVQIDPGIPGHPRHVAVLMPGDRAGELRMIHAANGLGRTASAPRGKVVYHRLDRAWSVRIVAAYAAPGVVDDLPEQPTFAGLEVAR